MCVLLPSVAKGYVRPFTSNTREPPRGQESDVRRLCFVKVTPAQKEATLDEHGLVVIPSPQWSFLLQHDYQVLWRHHLGAGPRIPRCGFAMVKSRQNPGRKLLLLLNQVPRAGAIHFIDITSAGVPRQVVEILIDQARSRWLDCVFFLLSDGSYSGCTRSLLIC